MRAGIHTRTLIAAIVKLISQLANSYVRLIEADRYVMLCHTALGGPAIFSENIPNRIVTEDDCHCGLCLFSSC